MQYVLSTEAYANKNMQNPVFMNALTCETNLLLTTVCPNVLKNCFKTFKILKHFNYINKKYFIFNKQPFLMVPAFFKNISI